MDVKKIIDEFRNTTRSIKLFAGEANALAAHIRENYGTGNTFIDFICEKPEREV